MPRVRHVTGTGAAHRGAPGRGRSAWYGAVMKATYWITTGLLALLLLSTGFLDITHQPMMVAGVTSLGYPAYFLTLDGLAKWAAAASILVPALAVTREWAYAGLTFLTLGAAWSHLACHQSPVPPLVVLLLVQASYLLWRRSRRVGDGRVTREGGLT
jgi:hypothetical protein